MDGTNRSENWFDWKETLTTNTMVDWQSGDVPLKNSTDKLFKFEMIEYVHTADMSKLNTQ